MSVTIHVGKNSFFLESIGLPRATEEDEGATPPEPTTQDWEDVAGGIRERAARLIDREGLQFVVAIGDGNLQALHPVCIAGNAVHLRQGIRLAGKGRVIVAPCLATFPTLAGFAGFEEIACCVGNRHGVSLSKCHCQGRHGNIAAPCGEGGKNGAFDPLRDLTDS